MLQIVLLVLALVVLAVLALAASKPNTFRVRRSEQIQAPPDRLFALIQDFHKWVAWSPWEKRDPALQRSYSGPADGRGAIYEWTGNKEVGSGRMEILTATPTSKVLIKLDFLQPFEAHNTAEFTLEPEGKGTRVTWEMYGPSKFIMKIFGLFMNMEQIVGKDFEQGLSNLKAIAENPGSLT